MPGDHFAKQSPKSSNLYAFVGHHGLRAVHHEPYMETSRKILPVMYVANVKTGSIISVYENVMLRFPNALMIFSAQRAKFLRLFHGHIQTTQIPVPLTTFQPF